MRDCLTKVSEAVVASRRMSEDTKAPILLRVPIQTVNRRRIAESELVIDLDGKIVKDRFGRIGRDATQDEMDEATEVYG